MDYLIVLHGSSDCFTRTTGLFYMVHWFVLHGPPDCLTCSTGLFHRMVCPEDAGNGQGSVSVWKILSKVRLEAVLWVGGATSTSTIHLLDFVGTLLPLSVSLYVC